MATLNWPGKDTLRLLQFCLRVMGFLVCLNGFETDFVGFERSEGARCIFRSIYAYPSITRV
jgi:hypothetical protein